MCVSSCFMCNIEVIVVTRETHIPFGTPNLPFLDIVNSFTMANQIKKLVLRVCAVRVQVSYISMKTFPL